jgi:hypothetical protein
MKQNATRIGGQSRVTGQVGWSGLLKQLIFLFYKYVKMTLFWTKFYKKKNQWALRQV